MMVSKIFNFMNNSLKTVAVLRLKYVLFSLSIVFLVGCGPDLPPEIAEARQDLPPQIDYNYHVKPILSDRCFACHGPDKNNQKAGLRLDREDVAKGELKENPGKFAIVPGKVGKSRLVKRILSEDTQFKMPPPESNLELTAKEKATLIEWIEQGAEYKPHWAFIVPERPQAPEVKDKSWPANEIDFFVLQKLEENGLEPSSGASKETLIRRASFDLTGLPPTLKEIDDFLADESANAYEKVIDRLLASPAYGERMATLWLDAARYADSHGYQDDGMRNIWPYRDWVIEKFNQNLPYDEFVTKQLSGDLFSNASQDEILATAFNRLHPQSQEGGIIPEEYRAEYVADRVNTFGKAFLGLTIRCARCHDHKYDPISQKEYYQLASFFNNVNESGKIPYVGVPSPALVLTNELDEEKIDRIKKKIKSQEEKLEEVNYKQDFENWVLSLENDPSKAEIELKGLIGDYPLDGKSKKGEEYLFRNTVNPSKPAKITGAVEDHPQTVEGIQGGGQLLSGREESWIDLGEEIGFFERHEPFSISIWIKVLEEGLEGPIFSRSGGTHNGHRGYEFMLEEDRAITASLIHSFPDNAISVTSESPIPFNKWIHLTMTYNGSSRAAGIKIYLNGSSLPLKITIENLSRSLIHYGKEEKIWQHGYGNLQLGHKFQASLKQVVVDEFKVFDKKLTALEVQQEYGKNNPLGEIIASEPQSRSAEQNKALLDYYLTNISPEYKNRFKKVALLREAENNVLSSLSEVMVMRERVNSRKTFILERGQYDRPTEKVEEGTPSAIMEFPDKLPPNRLGLARWLFDPQNPLTSRVVVNRFWQMLFGQGLVKTSNDFGNQGDLPSHPELLDLLAVRFVESDWDVKRFLKYIMISKTYRQSSALTPELLKKDPGNVYVARGPRYRMTAEMIRDNALATSGLLVKKIGGPPVKPYQPNGLWKQLATRNEVEYVQDHGENLYRRSLYTIWKRTSPPPSLTLFDASERNLCVVKRQKTSTPLQALVLMNDPQFVEASRVLAERIMKKDLENETEKISTIFRILTSRNPNQKELSILKNLYKEEHEEFRGNPQSAEELLSVGEYSRDKGLASPDVAALTIIASTLMNYNDVVFKR